jgi:hypothetical protein
LISLGLLAARLVEVDWEGNSERDNGRQLEKLAEEIRERIAGPVEANGKGKGR